MARLRGKPTLVGSLLANAATVVALGYARSPWLLGLGALAVGLATNASRPAQSAMIADLVPAANRVRAFALAAARAIERQGLKQEPAAELATA